MIHNKKLEHALQKVQKPGRYVGGELNSVVKDPSQVDVRFAFCFPDTYEIGMSHLGIKILYGAMNEIPYFWCERVFAPWVDMEEEMRREDIPLYALESGDPVSRFRLHRLYPAIRAELHQRAEYAGAGGHPPAQQGPDGAAQHCGGGRPLRLQPRALGGLLRHLLFWGMGKRWTSR